MSPSAVGYNCMVAAPDAHGKQERLLGNSHAIHARPGRTGRARRGDRENRPNNECLRPQSKSRSVVWPPVFLLGTAQSYLPLVIGRRNREWALLPGSTTVSGAAILTSGVEHLIRGSAVNQHRRDGLLPARLEAL